MSLIISIVKKQKQKIDYILEKYQKILSNLPKGTISEKKVNKNIYYYLKYRDGKKVVSKYIGKNDIETIRSQLERRHHIEVRIQLLTEEQKLAEKVLDGKI